MLRVGFSAPEASTHLYCSSSPTSATLSIIVLLPDAALVSLDVLLLDIVLLSVKESVLLVASLVLAPPSTFSPNTLPATPPITPSTILLVHHIRHVHRP